MQAFSSDELGIDQATNLAQAVSCGTSFPLCQICLQELAYHLSLIGLLSSANIYSLFVWRYLVFAVETTHVRIC